MGGAVSDQSVTFCTAGPTPIVPEPSESNPPPPDQRLRVIFKVAELQKGTWNQTETLVALMEMQEEELSSTKFLVLLVEKGFFYFLH